MNLKKPGWMSDHRLIADDAMEIIRHIAVAAIVERNKRPDDVSDMIGFSLSSIYEWLNRIAVDGYEGLKTRKAPGAPPIITKEMDDWLKTTVLSSTPEAFGYDTPLWTADILAELLQHEFGVTAASRTVNQHLKNLNLSYQKPAYHATEQNPMRLNDFLNDKFQEYKNLQRKLTLTSASKMRRVSIFGSVREKVGEPAAILRRSV
jgi:transposase